MKKKTKNPKNPILRGNVLTTKCPSRLILNSVTSKWSVLILFVLKNHGTLRFSEIRHSIDGISEKMLTQTLKSLEAQNLIDRKSYNVVPPFVEYNLTKEGLKMSELVFQLVDWIEQNLESLIKK